MDLGSWITWGITTLVAVAALILGIRAEIRSSHYEKRWGVTPAIPMRIRNRTGEDATEVNVIPSGDIELRRGGQAHWAFVAVDEELVVPLVPKNGRAATDYKVTVTWTRPRSKRTYEFTYPK